MTMSRGDKIANLLAMIIPLAGVLVAIVLLWNRAVDGIDLALLAGMYLVTGFGITVGFHRRFTHRSFAAAAPLDVALAVAGSMAVEGPLAHWVADHRKHHAHTDVEGDPHSPHVGAGAGLRGLWHAHMGWILKDGLRADPRRHARDILEDRRLARISRSFEWLVVLSLGLPAAIGFVAHGFTLAGLLTGLLWGGLVRIFLLHHVTWSINSVCHFTGARRFAIDDHSTNVVWLALPSLGEAWHHNHHAFPRSAAHGLRRWERALDPSAGLIGLLQRVGLVWDVVEIPPERQRQKEPVPAPAAS